MAIEYIPLQIDDVDNTYYNQTIQHSTRVLSPNVVPSLAPDSGSWFSEAATAELLSVDLVVKSVNSTGTPPTLYGHAGMLFSFSISSISKIITGYKLELNLTQYQPVVAGSEDGTLSVYIMNYSTGTWEKLGNSFPASASAQPWEYEITAQNDMSVDYSFGDEIHLMLFEEGADSTSTEMTIELDYAKLTLYAESGGPTAAQYLRSIKARVRAMTSFEEISLPNTQLETLIDIAIDEVGNAIISSIDLADKYHFLATMYFSCYLSMVAVYGPGIKSYRQDDNYVSFGDPYTKSKASWYLDRYAESVRKAGGFIAKSEYDIRTYVPPDTDKEDLKKMPELYCSEQLDDLDTGG